MSRDASSEAEPVCVRRRSGGPLRIALLCVVVWVGQAGAGPVWPSRTAHSADTPSRAEDFFRRHIEQKLEVGISIGDVRFRHGSRPADESRERTFLGYINLLNPVPSYVPRFFIGYHISDYFMLECTHDEVAVRTVNFNNRLSDGIVRMSGPVLSVIFKFPVHASVVPYLGLGLAPWKARFDHDAWWTLGWQSPELYAEAGSPPVTQDARRRIIAVDDDTAFTILGGLKFKLDRHLTLDARVRWHALSSKAVFYQVQDGVRVMSDTGSFDFEYIAYSLGVSFLF